MSGSKESGRPDAIGGLLSNVQRFSIHDGPGIRTTAFLMGCPLRCFWCHNPESLGARPVLQFHPERCIGCGACLDACPRGAHTLADGRRHFQRRRCTGCGACADGCYAEALTLVGKRWTAEDLVALMERDRPFYESSGDSGRGGITLSGGEPLAQPRFCLEVLRLCRQARLHTAIETSGHCRRRDLERLLPWLDLVILDVKLMDGERHRRATGAGNRTVLANARWLGSLEVPLIVRTPVVPTVNQEPEAIAAVAAFIGRFPNLLYYELMPFHHLAEGKYAGLGLHYAAAGLTAPEPALLEALARAARAAGLADVRVGA